MKVVREHAFRVVPAARDGSLRTETMPLKGVWLTVGNGGKHRRRQRLYDNVKRYSKANTKNHTLRQAVQKQIRENEGSVVPTKGLLASHKSFGVRRAGCESHLKNKIKEGMDHGIGSIRKSTQALTTKSISEHVVESRALGHSSQQGTACFVADQFLKVDIEGLTNGEEVRLTWVKSREIKRNGVASSSRHAYFAACKILSVLLDHDINGVRGFVPRQMTGGRR